MRTNNFTRGKKTQPSNSSGPARIAVFFTVGILFGVGSVDTAHAYYFEFQEVSDIAHVGFEDTDATGHQDHQHQYGIGLFDHLTLNTLTEVVASGGDVGSSRHFENLDTIERKFQIKKTDVSEAATTSVQLDLWLTGILTANPASGIDTYSVFSVDASVLGTGIAISHGSATTNANSKNINQMFSDSALLAVNQEYTLRLSLTTGAKATWNGSDAATARSDFMDTASTRLSFGAVPLPPAVFLFGSALGLLGWMRRKAS